MHDLGRPVAVLGRDVGVEHVGRLDEMVVDADEDEILCSHARLLTSRSRVRPEPE
jgi:hypothetical protein